jgi:hypothetical protein
LGRMVTQGAHLKVRRGEDLELLSQLTYIQQGDQGIISKFYCWSYSIPVLIGLVH